VLTWCINCSLMGLTPSGHDWLNTNWGEPEVNILMQTWPSSVHTAIHEKRITLIHSANAFLYIGQGHCTAATVTRRRPPEKSCNMPAQTLASVSQRLPQRTALFSKLTQMVNWLSYHWFSFCCCFLWKDLQYVRLRTMLYYNRLIFIKYVTPFL